MVCEVAEGLRGGEVRRGEAREVGSVVVREVSMVGREGAVASVVEVEAHREGVVEATKWGMNTRCMMVWRTAFEARAG